jgi:hypothetical protein
MTAVSARGRTPQSSLRHIVLTGQAKSVGAGQIEPGATPQVSFYLEIDDKRLGHRAVLIVIAQPLFLCAEGLRATMEAILYRPSRRSRRPCYRRDSWRADKLLLRNLLQDR